MKRTTRTAAKSKTSRKPAKRPRRNSTAMTTSQGRALADYCRGLAGTTEDVKWEDDLVFSVGGKMYAAFDIEDSDELGFKCDDIEFERLTKIDGIIPAPYAARFGWVKVQRKGVLPMAELKKLLERSHALVASCLPAKTRRALGMA